MRGRPDVLHRRPHRHSDRPAQLRQLRERVLGHQALLQQGLVLGVSDRPACLHRTGVHLVLLRRLRLLPGGKGLHVLSGREVLREHELHRQVPAQLQLLSV
jgi:hypothetical protein